MKRKILNVSIIIILTIMLVVLTACGTTEESEEKAKNNESISKNSLASKVKVGDYIAYNAGNNTYTLTEEKSGQSKEQVVESTGEEKWRVLSIEDDGTINIISEDGIGTKYEKEIEFFGETGYDNIVDELNNICKIFGNGKYAVSARSMEMSDLNKFLDVDSVVEYYENKYEQDITGNTAEEKFEKIYKLINKYYGEEIEVGGEKVSINAGYFDWKAFLEGSESGFDKHIENSDYMDLFKNEGIYLANQLIKCSGNLYCDFNVATYYTSYVNEVLYANYNDGEKLYSQKADENGKSYDITKNTTKGYVRPIVSLEKNLKVDGGKGTAEEPYTIK